MGRRFEKGKKRAKAKSRRDGQLILELSKTPKRKLDHGGKRRGAETRGRQGRGSASRGGPPAPRTGIYELG